MATTLYRDAAFADARSPELQIGISLLVEGRTISWMGPSGEEPDPGPGATIIDAGGATIVPAMVDSHSHISLPGGSHWIDRINDSTEDLLAAAERKSTGPNAPSPWRSATDGMAGTTAPTSGQPERG